jgi:hypothetical protein
MTASCGLAVIAVDDPDRLVEQSSRGEAVDERYRPGSLSSGNGPGSGVAYG